MRLLDRYLLRELLIPLGYCLGGFLIISIAFDLIASLNNFQEHSLRPADVAELYLVKLPDIFVFILPIALLLALLYTLTNLARHYELTAMRAAGVGLWRICLPYFAVGFILSLLAFALNELCVPDSKARQEQIINRHQHSAADPSVQFNLWFLNSRDDHKWQIGAYDFSTGVMFNPQVWWKQGGTNWYLRAERAVHVNGVWTFYGSTAFSTNDIVNLDSLAAKLKHPTNGVTQFLSAKLSSNSVALLSRHASGPDPDLQRSLAADFNHLLQRKVIYDSEVFAGVSLSTNTTKWLAEKPRGLERMQLNHLLLAEAFPQEVSKLSLYTAVMMKGDADSSFQMLRYLDTNRLTMPQFTEQPQDFVNEVKFASRLNGKLATDSGEASIADLLNYLKIHPNLAAKQRNPLETQLHGRFAEPWKCLVVVLIAIPFGAVSGRRNIFMGVAGSIVICFVYFILLRLALALGTGGYLPPWVAAWLPNAFFGVTGFWLTLRVR